MSRTLIYIHGQGFKPPPEELTAVWSDAARWGLQRDIPDALEEFDRVTQRIAYYGDCSNKLLGDMGKHYDAQLDLADYRNAITDLKNVEKRKHFRRDRYEKLPGKTSRKQLLADLGVPLLRPLGLPKKIVLKIAPDIVSYLDRGSDHRRELTDRVLGVITTAMDAGDRIMVIAHCLGSVIAYDALWQLSWGGHADGRYSDCKVDTFLTMGSPLGNETVKGDLDGAREPGPRRYPANILTWYNVAAHDDYMAHDKTVADDFRPMMRYRLVSRIQDFRIYNLAVRYGQSDPRSALGYLIHPRVARLIADWLQQ